MIAKSREWSVRLLHELESHEKAVFTTLTYSDECLPIDGSLKLRDLQLFWKRLRKITSEVKLKYFVSGEYGERYGRLHYHAIIFGLGLEDKATISSAWQNGMVHVGTVTYDSCRYVADYIMKKYDGKKGEEEYGDKERPFCKASKALGKNFALDQTEYIKGGMGITVRGVQVGIPRYYRKVIGLDNELLIEKAKDSFVERQNYFEEQAGGIIEATQAMINSRRAREKNLKAKVFIKKKGIL